MNNEKCKASIKITKALNLLVSTKMHLLNLNTETGSLEKILNDLDKLQDSLERNWYKKYV